MFLRDYKVTFEELLFSLLICYYSVIMGLEMSWSYEYRDMR